MISTACKGNTCELEIKGTTNNDEKIRDRGIAGATSVPMAAQMILFLFSVLHSLINSKIY